MKEYLNRAVSAIKTFAKWVGSLKTWELALGLLLFVILSAYFLRQNNLRMVELRQAVLAADEANEGIEEALLDLRGHILNHMNTNMAQPLELVASFNRAVEEARVRAEQSGSANAAIYSAAQAECERSSVPLTVRAQCIQDYVTSNSPPGSNPEEFQVPTKELFVYDFVSPRWSFDLAGISVLISAGLLLAIIGRFVAHEIAKRLLKRQE